VISTIKLLDEPDLCWVADAVDVVEAAAGQPWRVALDELDRLQRLQHAPQRFAAVVGAVQRILGGRTRNAKIARTTRSLVLGHPALDPATRAARIAAAAAALEVTSDTVERLLWSDLPRERPVELPTGRPSELEVAAFANVHLVQRALGRAHSVTIRVWGDAGPLIRSAALRGLVATACVGDGGAHVLEIVGPLALCHRTAVYGRALGGLVPLLGECERFELELRAQAFGETYSACIASPILLPSAPARMLAPSRHIAGLARALSRLDPRIAVAIAPAPFEAGRTLLCPELAIERYDGRWFVELVGFWTRELVDGKLAAYREAGANAIVCVDARRACGPEDAPRDPSVVLYDHRLDAEAVVAAIVGSAPFS
jgi:predicted nuclease of restriction endonuclease-like RecB superfamily